MLQTPNLDAPNDIQHNIHSLNTKSMNKKRNKFHRHREFNTLGESLSTLPPQGLQVASILC
ncbi:hypothetical protein ACQP3D_27265, partial [Escherichia coli]